MKKTIVKIIIVMMLIAFIYPLKSQAALQGNKNGKSLITGSGVYANQLFIGIRKMEVGTIGKQAQDAADGIDCHMAKNTEWGTAAMLSASDYGNAPIGSSSATTTGNESGVCQMADGMGNGGYELVAGIWNTSNQYMSTIKSADPKYYDLYTSNTSKQGDATLETDEWKGAKSKTFISNTFPIFTRSWGGLFGYYNNNGWYGSGSTNYPAGSRAVAVCGPGL